MSYRIEKYTSALLGWLKMLFLNNNVCDRADGSRPAVTALDPGLSCSVKAGTDSQLPLPAPPLPQTHSQCHERGTLCCQILPYRENKICIIKIQVCRVNGRNSRDILIGNPYMLPYNKLINQWISNTKVKRKTERTFWFKLKNNNHNNNS